jgi:hypothetical protein
MLTGDVQVMAHDSVIKRKKLIFHFVKAGLREMNKSATGAHCARAPSNRHMRSFAMANDTPPYEKVTQSAAGAGAVASSSDRVGYGHPPTHAQFRPGQSGNPSGRPKRRRKFRMDLAAALDAASAGASAKTKQKALAENLVNDALAGNTFAIRIVASLALTLDDNDGNREGDMTAFEQKLIADFDRRNESKEKAGERDEPEFR